MMILSGTCSKDTGFLPGEQDMNDLKSTEYCGPVFAVYPSGGDDTQAIMDAIEHAKNAGPGAVVKLAKGIFTIGFIEIHDFNGVFKGSGRNFTKITNLENLPCDLPWLANTLPALMKFIGGDVTVSDLTFQIRDGRPCAFSEINDMNVGDLFSVLIMADYSGTYMPANRTIKATVRNTAFAGGRDDGYGIFGTTHNTAVGCWFGPDFFWPVNNEPFGNGFYTINGCSFDFFLDGAEGFGLGREAMMRVMNSTFTGGLWQLYYTANSGSRHIIAGNYFEGATGTDITMEDLWTDLVFPSVNPMKRTEFVVKENVFNSGPGVNSIFLNDYMRNQTGNDQFAMLFDIHDNVFRNQENGTGIVGQNNKDARIINNMFKGTGTMGIRVDGDAGTGIFATNISILGNSFRDATYTGPDIYLGPYSKFCKVIGAENDEIENLGTDNKIVGKKFMRYNSSAGTIRPGQMQGMHDLLMKRRLVQPR